MNHIWSKTWRWFFYSPRRFGATLGVVLVVAVVIGVVNRAGDGAAAAVRPAGAVATSTPAAKVLVGPLGSIGVEPSGDAGAVSQSAAPSATVSQTPDAVQPLGGVGTETTPAVAASSSASASRASSSAAPTAPGMSGVQVVAALAVAQRFSDVWVPRARSAAAWHASVRPFVTAAFYAVIERETQAGSVAATKLLAPAHAVESAGLELHATVATNHGVLNLVVVAEPAGGSAWSVSRVWWA